MKKYRKRLSIILTLVMIITSIGFTGAFANDEGTTEGADQNVQAVEQAENVDAAAEGETGTSEEAAPAEDAAPAEETTPAEAAPAEEATGAEDAAPAAEAAAADAVETFKITWKNDDGTVLAEEQVEKGTVPEYKGEAPTKAEDEAYVYEFSGWDPEPAEATADATYTAKYDKKAKGTTAPAAPVVKKNNNGQAYASYKSVRIEWDPVTKDADGVEYAEGVTVTYKVTSKSSAVKLYKVSNTSYRTNKVLKPFTTYTFYVQAFVKTPDGKEVASAKTTIKGSPVKSIRYKLTIKEGSTLKRHAGSGPRTYNLKSGVTIDTDRFQTGKYIFEYKGSIFYISQTRVRKASALYNKKGSWNYLQKEAEYYIKDRGVGSATKNLIFVNTFCQHVYYFEKKDGKWDCTDGWECGTGLASTPTPTGNYGKKYIHDRIRKKNGIPYWNLFNGNAALHATKPNDHRVGMVISNGCVRNPDAKAKKIYTKTALKTRVLIV